MFDCDHHSSGGAALDCNVQMIETMEYEFIHVLQDEMAGIWNSDAEILGLPITPYAETSVANGTGERRHHQSERRRSPRAVATKNDRRQLAG
jgi:hypothetical protein